MPAPPQRGAEEGADVQYGSTVRLLGIGQVITYAQCTMPGKSSHGRISGAAGGADPCADLSADLARLAHTAAPRPAGRAAGPLRAAGAERAAAVAGRADRHVPGGRVVALPACRPLTSSTSAGRPDVWPDVCPRVLPVCHRHLGRLRLLLRANPEAGLLPLDMGLPDRRGG
eukprot:5630167-Prymnesium_polylepis.1